MKADPAVNRGSATCNVQMGDGWITGNTLIDRDTYGAGDYGDFGVSLSSGRVAFGISSADSGVTICTSTDVDDARWHHIAITRSSSQGSLTIFVDGIPMAHGVGPAGDVSYRDGRQTSFQNDPFLVIGAEKHDAGSGFPSFIGWFDELRISSVIRYNSQFSVPTVPFAPDLFTAALYHFDEGPLGACTGAVLDASGAIGGPSHGQCRYGGSTPAGPEYSIDHPFASVSTPTNTRTQTYSPTATASQTPTPAATQTGTPAPTTTATWTPTPTTTETRTATPTATQTQTTNPTATQTSTLTPTATKTQEPADTVTPSATATMTHTPTPTGDATPPEIIEIELMLFDTLAFIRWRTNELAISQVRFGLAYPPVNALPFTSQWSYEHSFVTRDMTPGATYYFQAVSADLKGNLRVHDIGNLTTLKAGENRRQFLSFLVQRDP
jgi:hypothetical protein